MYNVTTLISAVCSSVFVFDNWMPLNTGPELEPKIKLYFSWKCWYGDLLSEGRKNWSLRKRF